MNKEELQNEFNKLTCELKEMTSDDNRYGRIWNERAEIAGKIRKAEEMEKLFIAKM